MEYLLMMGIGIIIGMLVVIAFNVKKTKEEEERFFEEYKELVDKCFQEDSSKKNESK